MEQIFFRLHSNILSATTKFLNKPARGLIEYLVFFIASSLFFFQIFIHLHILNSNSRSSCIENILLKEGINLNTTDVLQIHVPLFGSETSSHTSKQKQKPHYFSVDHQFKRGIFAQLNASHFTTPCPDTEPDCVYPENIYLYSMEKGYLMLNQQLRDLHKIKTAECTILPKYECFGPKEVHFLIHQLVGYDTIIMNWVISLSDRQGFFYNVRSRELANLNHAKDFLDKIQNHQSAALFRFGVLFTTCFLFFTTTTLVSFTLRETQTRMLKFTFLLQHHVRNHLPYAPLIFTHVVESLIFVPIMVGILFFLFEFFSDQMLAFMVLSMVWTCEVYSVISVRTRISITYFPRIFLLYFTVFHVYFFCYPFGFSYLALFTTMLFLIHSMLYFWNRFEVPAFQTGTISINRPRMTESLNFGPTGTDAWNQYDETGIMQGEEASHNRPASLLHSDPRRNIMRNEPWFPFNLFQQQQHHENRDEDGPWFPFNLFVSSPPQNVDHNFHHPHRHSDSSAQGQQETHSENHDAPWWPFNMFIPHLDATPELHGSDQQTPHEEEPQIHPQDGEEPWFWDLFANRPSRESSQNISSSTIEEENKVSGSLEVVDHAPFPFNLFGGEDRLKENSKAKMAVQSEDMDGVRSSEIGEKRQEPPPFPFNLFQQQQQTNEEEISTSSDTNMETVGGEERSFQSAPSSPSESPPFPFNLFHSPHIDSKHHDFEEKAEGGAGPEILCDEDEHSVDGLHSKATPVQNKDSPEREANTSEPPPFPFNIFGEDQQPVDGKESFIRESESELLDEVHPDPPPFPFNLFVEDCRSSEDRKELPTTEREEESRYHMIESSKRSISFSDSGSELKEMEFRLQGTTGARQRCVSESSQMLEHSLPPPFPFNLFVDDQWRSGSTESNRMQGRLHSLSESTEDIQNSLSPNPRSKSLER
mmetsp:Transcript_25820/g.33850  ORF Transcript_25820/g.33850 Transcript_25820/m.33850 type:complete len:929 (+) Transcript_25820:122-2908(+)